MKIDLTIKQIEAIQKLLSAHSEVAGHIPKGNTCLNAYLKIIKQTGITKFSKDDKRDMKEELKNMEIQ